MKSFPENVHWKIKLFNNWDNIIGNLKDRVHIEKIEARSITLGVSHPVWAQELNLLSNVFKNKINKILESDQIDSIRFKVLNKKIPLANSKQNNPLENLKLREISFSIKEQRSLDRIKDKDLQKALAQYYKNRIVKK